MLRHPLNEEDFSFSKWQFSSTLTPNPDSQPGSLSLSQLDNRPFDLSNAVMSPTGPSQKNKPAQIVTQVDDEQLSTPTSNTGDDQSMIDENEMTTFTCDITSNHMDCQVQSLVDDYIWDAIVDSSTDLPQQPRLSSWDDDNDNTRLGNKTIDHSTRSHSPYLTESSSYMKALCQIKFPDVVVVDNERLIKDIAFLLTGVSSMCFEWKNDKRIFQLCENGIRLVDLSPGVMQRILQPMVIFGSRMKMLEDLTAYVRFHPKQFGSVAVAFACCLGELLSSLQHSIVSFVTPQCSSTNQDNRQPQLLEIHHHMGGLYYIMRHLADLCSMKTSKGWRCMIPRGADLLTLVYNKLMNLDDLQTGHTAFLKAIYMTLLIDTSAPWLAILTRWLNDGVVHDPYHDFFIIDNGHNKSGDKKRASMTIDTSALPCFLPKTYAKMVLHAGISMLRQKVDPTMLDEFCLCWPDSSWSSKMGCIIPQHTPPEITTYPFNSPPKLATLPDLDAYHRQKHLSIVILGECMLNQGNDFTIPLSIFMKQLLLDPIHQRYQLISSLSTTSSTAQSLSSLKPSRWRNMLFTYWNGHGDQYPTTFYSDLVTPPFQISTFLRQQRHHLSSLSTPSSSSSFASSPVN